jgi:hypothetical protein
MKAGVVITSVAAVALLAETGPATAQQGSGASTATTSVPGRSVADLAMLCNAGLQDPSRPDALGYCNESMQNRGGDQAASDSTWSWFAGRKPG